MQKISKVQKVNVFSTSDGKAFDDRDAANKHQSILNLRSWFQATVDEATAVQLVDAIASDVDGFREIVHPILVKPRAPRGSKATGDGGSAGVTPIDAGGKRKAA